MNTPAKTLPAIAAGAQLATSALAQSAAPLVARATNIIPVTCRAASTRC
jgi:hypothetical protein